MGLAEPRKRVKISHDPRNLQWLSPSSDSTSTSFGKRLMQQQGWRQGQALGARPPASGNGNVSHDELDAQRLAAAKVGVIIKDDTLGLGAQLRSKDVAHQKTGLDAFQGLLGRLNAKDEEELKEVERKEGDRKLEMYAKGRWGGGVVFVRGGVLKPEQDQQGEEGKKEEQQQQQQQQQQLDKKEKKEKEEGKKEKKSKEEKKKNKNKNKKAAQSKEEEEKKKSKKKEVVVSLSRPVYVAAPDEPKTSSEEEEEAEAKEEKKKKEKEKKEKRRRSSTAAAAVVEETATTTTTTAAAATATKKQVVQLSNGRHILRGRNIEAKRKAFSDTKGLDAIFMKTTTATATATSS